MKLIRCGVLALRLLVAAQQFDQSMMYFKQLNLRNSPVRARRWIGVVITSLALVAGTAEDIEEVDPVVPKVTLDEVLAGRIAAGFQPEYDRNLDRVLLSVHSLTERAWLETNLRAMSLLPVYSSVLMVVPKWTQSTDLGRFEAIAKERGGASRVVTSPLPEAWVQDIGEGSGDGFMLGFKGVTVAQSVARLGIQTYQHFLPLDGGNIHLARNRDGRRFVMVGSEEFGFGEHRVAEQPGAPQADLRSLALDVYRRTFGADEVIVLPNLDGVHIDQMVLCLGDGVVATEVLPEPTESDRHLLVNFLVEWANAARVGATTRVDLYAGDYRGDSRRVAFNSRSGKSSELPLNRFMTAEQKQVFLRYRAECPHLYDLLYSDAHRRNRLAIERRLVEKGFEVVHLKTSVWHMHNCQTFVNAMPFRHRETGKPGVLMPVYGYAGAPEEAIDLDNLRGLNRENVETLRALGYEVIPVPSHVQLGGNLHCSIYQF